MELAREASAEVADVFFTADPDGAEPVLFRGAADGAGAAVFFVKRAKNMASP